MRAVIPLFFGRRAGNRLTFAVASLVFSRRAGNRLTFALAPLVFSRRAGSTPTFAIASLVFALGCSLDETGLVGPMPDAGFEAAPLDARADVVDAPSESASCVPASCEGERCTADACDYYPSCAAMHAADPSRATGPHHFNGSNGPFIAWCDMDTALGGWTLVARSAMLGSSSTFGWFKTSNTDPTKRTLPYSLSAPAMGIVFTQALVGQVDQLASGPNVWGANVNQLDLPSGFPGNFQASAGSAVVTVLTSSAGCTSFQVTMLTNVGFTSDSTNYFFRDNTVDSSYGLAPDGFHLAYFLSCKSAEMDSTAGMLMVR